MADWQITATTIYCNDVDDEVTVIVNRDGAVRCVKFGKYGEPGKDTVQLKCGGPECSLVIEYRDRLFAEEANRAGPSEKNGPEKQPK
jgi:hypothetical protein